MTVSIAVQTGTSIIGRFVPVLLRASTRARETTMRRVAPERLVLRMALCSFVAPISAANAQHGIQVIRGVVTDSLRHPVRGAHVIATMAPRRDTFATKADSLGKFVLRIPNGTGDYLIYIASPGLKSYRKRLTFAAADTALEPVTLRPDVQTLATVRATASRTPPPRDDDEEPTAGAGVVDAAGVAGALSPRDAGSLSALASTVPGIALTNSGISAFGMDPSQNRYTLNGLTFTGDALPRDMVVHRQVILSPYDPTLGGFGGAMITAQLAPGQVLTFGHGHVSAEPGMLQALGPGPGGIRSTAFGASFARSGELIEDSWVYSIGVEAQRESQGQHAADDLTADQMRSLGLSVGEVERALSALSSLGVSPAPFGTASDASERIVGAFRVDRARATKFGGLERDTSPRIGFVGWTSMQRERPSISGPLSTSSTADRGLAMSTSVQANMSRYFGTTAAYLDELRSGVSVDVGQTRPALDVPSGTGLLHSGGIADGSTDALLEFGGGPRWADSRHIRWETVNRLSFSSNRAPTHRLKLSTRTNVEAYSTQNSYNRLGTFQFSSIDDLEANRPSAFTRELQSPRIRGGQIGGAMALSDYWTPSPELQVVYGPRIDWQSYSVLPHANSALVRAFGQSNRTAPSGLAISPRVGFSWLYRGISKSGPARGSRMSSALGTAHVPPKGVLRGGVGRFQGDLPATLLSEALRSTGLPGDRERLTCVGPTAPTPEWPLYAKDQSMIPAACAGGSNDPNLGSTLPTVSAFAPGYRNPARWTATAGWSSAFRDISYSLDVSQSYALHLPSDIDLNLAARPAFILPAEGLRPVFAAENSIDPGSGEIGGSGARANAAFGPVIQHRSDSRGVTSQATLVLQPLLPQSRWIVSGAYTLTRGKQLQRGFDGTASGDPRTAEWAPTSLPRHQIRLQLGTNIPAIDGVLTSYWSVQSGTRYTPVVGEDINGDGLANDRAYVFSPDRAPPTLARDLTSLTTSGSSTAQKCLARQRGTIAARNSCVGPWTVNSNVRMDWAHRFGNRYRYANFSISIANPAAAIARMFHENSHAMVWGGLAVPDPVLYHVTGFDPQAQKFEYRVNPGFGRVSAAAAALFAPFRITVEASFSLMPDVVKQQVSYYLRPDRSARDRRPSAETILTRIRGVGAPAVPDPLNWILANADSLLLSADQLVALQRVQADHAVHADSVWRKLARDLSALPADYDTQRVMARIDRANDEAFDTEPEVRAAARVLNEIQVRLVPADISKRITAARAAGMSATPPVRGASSRP